MKLAGLIAFPPLATGAGEVQKKLLSVSAVNAPLSTSYLLQFCLGLILVLATVMLLAWLLRRLHQHSPMGGALRLLGVLSLGTRERIMLIQVGETQLLLGVTPGHIQTLHRLTKPLVGLAEDSDRIQRGAFPRLMESAFKRSASKMARQS